MTDSNSYGYRESATQLPAAERPRAPGEPGVLPVRLFVWRRCGGVGAVRNRGLVGSVGVQVRPGRAACAGRVQQGELLPALVTARHHIRPRRLLRGTEWSVTVYCIFHYARSLCYC